MLGRISEVYENADLKLGDVSSLSISYNITISWLYPQNGSRIIYIAWHYHDVAHARTSSENNGTVILSRHADATKWQITWRVFQEHTD